MSEFAIVTGETKRLTYRNYCLPNLPFFRVIYFLIVREP